MALFDEGADPPDPSAPLSHITFVVSDLDKMKNLIEEVFCGREIYDSQAKNFSFSREKFFLIGNLWIAIMQGASRPAAKTYDHVAFHVQESDLPKLAHKIVALGLTMEKGRKRVKGEGESLYFRDWDGHLFELHAGSLRQRLERYCDESNPA